MPQLAYRRVYGMNDIEARRLLIETYEETGSLSETARQWQTSRHIVRKWVRRYREEGEAGLESRSQRPHRSPRQTAPEVEQQVMEAWEKTNYGRHRLAIYLRQQGLELSPHTVRHILRRRCPARPRKRRKVLYPAHWAWEVKLPFTLVQVDVKDILDKGALGTRITTHMGRQGLPRYQWTACDARTRLRFLAYSHHITRTNGLAFLVFAAMFLRALGIEGPIAFQSDWGQEFGGDNPHQVATLSLRFLSPLDAELARYPMGRKGYNGRVERSHRTDDEEFYRPYLLQVDTVEDFLKTAQKWTYFYNGLRPHFGYGMNARTPLAVLQSLGYTGSQVIAAFPPLLLDEISTDLLLACDPQDGIDLLAHYTATGVRSRASALTEAGW